MDNTTPNSSEPKHSRNSPLRKNAIIVLGMHRSGTSSLAGTLTKLGVAGPKSLLPATDFNEQGHFESIPIMHLNDAILASAGTDWHDWRAFNGDWYDSVLCNEFVEKGAAVIDDEFGDYPLIVVKDPRMCRLMPLWTKVFERTGHQLHIIMPLRSPLEVAQSLKLRDDFPISKGVLLWLRHVLDAEAVTRLAPSAIISWQDFLNDWRMTVSHIQERANITFPNVSDQSSYNIDAFLNGKLRHHNIDEALLNLHPDVHKWAREAYAALLTLSAHNGANSAREIIDQIRNEFEIAAKCFGRTLVDFQESEGQARRDLAAESARAQQCAEQRDGALAERAALADQFAAVSAERDRYAAELDAQRQHSERLAAEFAVLADQFAAACAERDRHAAELDAQRQHSEWVAAEFAALAEQLAAACAERDRRAAELDTQREDSERRGVERAALVEQIATAVAEGDRRALEIEKQQEICRTLEQALAASQAAADVSAAERDHLLFERDELATRLARESEGTAALAAERDALAAMLPKVGALVAAAIGKQRRLALRSRREIAVAILRQANIVDEPWYLEQNPDVRAAGVDPVKHFLIFGMIEGRKPSTLADEPLQQTLLSIFENVK